MTTSSERISSKLAELTRRDRSDIRAERTLRELVHDSFTLVEVMVDLQEEFGLQLSQEDFAGVVTVGDLTNLIDERVRRQAV
jgi:acyl carrier protein